MTILSITPNPAFDRIQTIPNFNAGKVWRATSLTLSAGGKGVNLARAARTLGKEVVCTGFLGGHSGRMEAQFTSLEGIKANWVWIDGETRVSIIVVDPETNESTVLNEAGPTINGDDWERLQNEVLKLSAQAEATCICGSLPLGLHPDAMGELIRNLNRTRHPVWVDSSGKTLKTALEARPAAVKINHLEAAALLGWRKIEDVATALQAAQTIQHSGVSKTILTLEEKGAVLASDAGAWYAKPPKQPIVCPVGSGDAFLAGLIVAVLNDASDAEALRCGVAAGSANTLSKGGGKFTRQEFEQVFAKTTVKALV